MSKNEAKKTGIFWGVAGITTLLAAIVAWPTASTDDERLDSTIGKPLFAKFTDPLAAGNMTIVTFNDEQGTLQNFEVKRDEESGLWTIPSRGGYPADAVEQMREAANAFVDLNVLDVPSINAEDHEGFGVLVPDAEKLNVGDEGVGRLVSFRDAKSNDLASLIIGKEVPNQEGQVYVRIPNQDPVYVVKLDDSPLTTEFEDWIEEDLLQLSSIDIQNMEVKDYNASITLRGVSLNRNFNASFDMDGTQWSLASLKEFADDPLAEPTPVEVDPIKTVNTKKLNEMKNALDDLKFVDVLRKPDGISADLKADKDFASDQDAARQLASKGFIPVPMGVDGAIEILSANGELTTTLKSGVKYILRFGNIAGVSKGDDSDEDEESDAEGENADEEKEDEGGVNRYLMVSTVVDESMFPAPELEKIPADVAEMEAMEKAEKEEEEEKDEPPALTAPEQNTPEMKEEETPKEDKALEETSGEKPAEEKKSEEDKSDEKRNDDDKADESSSDEKKTEEKSSEDKPAESPEATDEKAKSDKPAEEAAPSEEAESSDSSDSEGQSGETEAEGSGEATVVGEGQEEDEKDAGATDEPAKSSDGDNDDAKTDSPDEKPAAEASPEKSDADDKAADAPDAKEGQAEKDAPADEPKAEETEEEKLERLAAVQERITKENERKIDERNEKLEEARRKSRELNQRFADWYYVIPEATYSKLRIDREEIFASESDAQALPQGGMPPGFPGGGFGGPSQQFSPPPGVGN